MADSKVLVVMGSDSDFPVMEGCFKMLNKFGVGFKATVASAHRTPDKAMALARGAEAEGFKVIIAAAGLAAHLGGVLAANTALPVIGVPCKGGALAGVDALRNSSDAYRYSCSYGSYRWRFKCCDPRMPDARYL